MREITSVKTTLQEQSSVSFPRAQPFAVLETEGQGSCWSPAQQLQDSSLRGNLGNFVSQNAALVKLLWTNKRRFALSPIISKGLPHDPRNPGEASLPHREMGLQLHFRLFLLVLCGRPGRLQWVSSSKEEEEDPFQKPTQEKQSPSSSLARIGHMPFAKPITG